MFDCIGILFKYRGDDYYWSLDVDQGFIECNYNVITSGKSLDIREFDNSLFDVITMYVCDWIVLIEVESIMRMNVMSIWDYSVLDVITMYQIEKMAYLCFFILYHIYQQMSLLSHHSYQVYL